MAQAKRKKVTRRPKEVDSVYFLKLVLYLVVGSLWLRIDAGNTVVPLPVGLLIGALFASHEHFQIDRKIEYALLLVATFVGFWLPIGLVIQW